ncbi:hypothetical protein ACWCQ0_54135, partial [Streptomyces massasporeus]
WAMASRSPRARACCGMCRGAAGAEGAAGSSDHSSVPPSPRSRVRWRLYGHGALLLAYGLLLAPLPDPVVLLGVLLLLGVFYAATDGVLMALAGPFLTEGRQASGLAVVQTAQALARLGAAVAFGAVWTASGPETALVAALLALTAAMCCAARLLPTTPSEPSERSD